MTWSDVLEGIQAVRPYAGFAFLLAGAGFYFWAIATGKSRLRDIARKQARLEHLAHVEASLFRTMEARRNEAYCALEAVRVHWNNHPGDPGIPLIMAANAAGLALSQATKAWQAHLNSTYGVTPAGDDAGVDGDAEAVAVDGAAPPSFTVDLDAEADPAEVPEREQ